MRYNSSHDVTHEAADTTTTMPDDIHDECINDVTSEIDQNVFVANTKALSVPGRTNKCCVTS